MSPTLAGYLVFGTYIVLNVAIGFWSGRQQKGADDLWTAGRRFGTVVMVLGLMSSIMHGGSILSGVAFAATYGGVAILPLISFAAGFLVILLFFARKLRDIGAFTLSDFMADRYNSVGLRAFTAIVIAVSCTVYLVAQIRGMGIVLSGLLNLPFVPAMAVGTLLFVFYVVVGGILAVMWNNIAQFLIMWLGLIVIIPYVWQTAGGWTEVIERAEALAPGWTSVAGTQWSWAYLLSWWLVWFIAYSTRIELITKVFIARDSNVARYALPTTCLLVMLFLLFGNLYLGAAARVLVFDGLSTPDAAFPALVTRVLGPVATAIVLTSIASAANESLLLLAGAAVAHDLVRKSWHERAGIMRSEAYYLFVSRVTLVVVGVVSFVAAINTPALILAIVSYSIAMIGATFFFPLLFGLSSQRTTPAAAAASSIGGFFTTVVWTALTLVQVPWAAAIHPIVPGLAVALVLIVAVTPFTRPAPPNAVARFFKRSTEVPMNARTMLTTTTMVLVLAVGASAQPAQPAGPQRSPAERAAAAQAEREKMMAMARPIDAVDSVWLEELTWLEVRDAIRGGKTTIIIPTGGMEQNGPYLATGKHNYVNRAGCEAIARKLGNALCAPNVAFVPEGNFDPPSGALMYPGSIGVSDATFQALLSDIANSFRVTGFQDVILIGDSGGNQRGMKEVASSLSAKWAGGKTRIHYIADYYDRFNEVVQFAEKTFGWKQVPDGSHDDALITAIIMTVNPDHVRMKQRTAKGLTKTNAIELAPTAKAIEVGKAIVNRRAEITVDAIKKAIANSTR